MITVFKNVTVITPWEQKDAVVVVKDGVIAGVHSRCDIPEGAEVIDGGGRFLSSGFMDIHVHGGGGHSVMSCDAEEIRKMAEAHAEYGTTSIVPTTLASPIPVLEKAVDAVKAAQETCTKSNILGVHLEGPFLAQSQRGAQSPDSILVPAEHNYIPLLERWDGIRMMGAAPETEGALALGRELEKRGIVASVAHSDATYDQVLAAVENGFRDVTHIYSGCSLMKRVNGYRVADVVEAGLTLDELTVQVIGDLRHLPVSLIRLIYRCKGADKIALITDGLEYSASTLEEGTTYVQENGVATVYEDGVMKLMDRTAFAGSVATMSRLVKNMYHHAGISLNDAVRMATLTPASILGLAGKKGRVAAGYDADLILYGDDVEPYFVMVGGRIIKNTL